MVVRRRSTSPRWIFSASWIGAARGKAKSRPNGRRKIVAKFFPESWRAKRSARRLECSFATKTRGRRITPRSQKNSDRRTQTLLTKGNTESGIGGGGGAPRGGTRRAQCAW